MAQKITSGFENVFGDVPMFIQENAKYLSFDHENDELFCIPCKKVAGVVEIDDDSTFIDFNSHLQSKTHSKVSVSTNTLWQDLNNRFSGKIPQLILQNLKFLGMDGSDYFCEICEKIVKVSEYNEVTEKNFLYHLMGETHLSKLDEWWIMVCKLQDYYGVVPNVVRNNKDFLALLQGDYFCLCTLCNKKLMIHPSDSSETKNKFEEHLFSLGHVQNYKHAKALIRIPQLKIIYNENQLPDYILRNINYLYPNGNYLYCSLCEENIKFIFSDSFLTEQCLRLHIFLASGHALKLKYRMYKEENEAYNKLKWFFGTFDDEVLNEFEFLTIIDGQLGCGLCEIKLEVNRDVDNTKQNIIDHFGDNGPGNHADRFYEREKHRTYIKTRLAEVFGSLPDTILMDNNISFIECKGQNEFECIHPTCEGAILQAKMSGDDSELKEEITEENFRKHIESKKHLNSLNEYNDRCMTVSRELENLFEAVPQFIGNVINFQFDEDEEEFICLLCNISIPIDRGDKRAEVTSFKFKSHILSPQHFLEVRRKADINFETIKQLETIFGGTPEFILSNLDHIDEDDKGFYCSTCIGYPRLEQGSSCITTEHNFWKHLSSFHHREAVEQADQYHQDAFRRLDYYFSRIPEFLMRQLDHLTVYREELFCTLCQMNLNLDPEDLDYTKEVLRVHMDSDIHTTNLNHF